MEIIFLIFMFYCSGVFSSFVFCGLVSLNSLFCMSDLQVVVKFCLQGFTSVCYRADPSLTDTLALIEHRFRF